MAEQLIPVTRTIVTLPMYAQSLVDAWNGIRNYVSRSKTELGLARPDISERMGKAPSKATAAVLFAQYMIETGGTSSWNWNIGNAKHVKDDGHDYHMLQGVWEGVSLSAAESLISSGQAKADPSADHAAAVGAGKVSVIFSPPHPATWFRAFENLADGMTDHLKLLPRRFMKGWEGALAGNVDQFAQGLKAGGYFTADAGMYANGMRRHFARFMADPTFDEIHGRLDLFRPASSLVFKSKEDAAVKVAATAATGGLLYGLYRLYENWRGTR